MSSLVATKKALVTAQRMILMNRSTAASRAGAAAVVLINIRSLAIRRRVVLEDPSKFHPNDTIDSVKPPHYWTEPDPDAPEPMMYIRKPVTSASAIDFTSKLPKLSTADTVSLTAEGTVRHGRYGILPRNVVENIPLEYLTLLHPSAQAAAALRSILEHPSNVSSTANGGTLLVYGESQPAGMAATQLAASYSGRLLAVIAVVDGQHSGDSEMMDCVKHMAPYPGTAVPEEFALIKRDFYDLVNLTVAGEQQPTKYDCSTDFLEDFVSNLVEYANTFPQARGAAIDPALKVFAGKERDRAKFNENMEAYLEQFPQGVRPLPSREEIQEKFGPHVYAVYKSRFGIQTSSVISGDEDLPEFEPSQLVKTLMYTSPDAIRKELVMHNTSNSNSSAEFVPYEFDVLSPIKEEVFKGVGPVIGAVIVATPTLIKACEAVAKCKTLREKAEALQYLTNMEQKAFAAASAVYTVAKKVGKQVVVVGEYSLPGQKIVELQADDVQTALSAMEIQDDGSSRLNFFVQVYRAGDFPVYENYAIHRATEPLSGPRQIVVTK